MKKLLYLMVFIYCKICFGQASFQNTYSLGYGKSVHQTSDSGYVLFGNISPVVPINGWDMGIIKIDQNGDTMWTRAFGQNLLDDVKSGQQTSDGGYILLGATQSAGGSHAYLIRTNHVGDTLWTRLINDVGRGMSIQQTIEGEYIVACVKLLGGGQSEDFGLVKIDSLGDVKWEKGFGIYINDEIPIAVRQTTDNGYIIVGGSLNDMSETSTIYIIKTDEIGDTLWTRRMTESGNDVATSIQQTLDGAFIVSGHAENDHLGTSNLFIMKLDTLGDTLWTKAYGGPYIYPSGNIFVQQTADSGFILIGSIWQQSYSATDLLLIKTNSIGDTLWTRAIGRIGFDHGYFVQQTVDGGYIISGTTQSISPSYTSVYLVKTDSLGHTLCNESNPFITVGNHNVSVINSLTHVSIGNSISVPANTIVSEVGMVSGICGTVGISGHVGIQNF